MIRWMVALVLCSVSAFGQVPVPVRIEPVAAVALYDRKGAFVGNLQSIDFGNAQAMVALKISGTLDPADVLMLRYSWRDAGTMGPGSEWLGPGAPGNGKDQIFFEGANCTGRAFLGQVVSPTPRFVGISGDNQLWMSEPGALASSHTIVSALNHTDRNRATCQPVAEQPIQSVEVKSAGDLDALFLPPLNLSLIRDVEPASPRRRAVRR